MTAKEERPLGLIETQMTLFHHEFRGTTQGCQLALLTGLVRGRVLRDAASMLFEKYQALRCAIVRRDTGWVFVEHADFARIAVVQRTASVAETWEEAFVDELNRPLEASTALWRLLVLEEPASGKGGIILTCHHAIMDGVGMFAMLEDLLSFSDLLMSGERATFERRGMPAPIDTFLLPARQPQRVATAPSPCEPISFQRQASLADRSSHILRVTLRRQDQARLKDAAIRQRSGLNSILAAAVAKAAHASGVAPSVLSLKTAVSLRDRVSGTDEYRNCLGCYIAVADCSLDVSSPSLTDLAASYELQLLACIFQTCIRRSGVTAAALTARIQSLRESTTFAHGIGITNIGGLPFEPQFRHFRLDDVVAASNRNAGNVAFVVSAMDFDDRLSFIITYTEPLMRGASIREFGGVLTRTLSQYATT